MKKKILDGIQKLPAPVMLALSRFNTDPRRVFGKAYAQYRSELQAGIPPELTRQRLMTLLRHAVQHVPYYRELYAGREPGSMDEFMATFGFTDKVTIAAQVARFQSDQFNKSAYDLVTTGGTSGKPLQFYAPRDRYVVEWATVHHNWARAGYHFDMRAVLRNHRLPEDRLYQVNPVTKEVQFDNFRLDEAYMGRIYETLRKMNLRFMQAYPSAAYQFATFCHQEKLDISFLKAILSSSENVYQHQLDFIRGQSGTRLFAHYGHSEKLVFAAFCEHSDYYHVEDHYGYFELIGNDGQPLHKEGDSGEIVGTTINNFGMPLIRYRTGDHAELLGDTCPACGRKGKVLRKITGRWDGDKIYNRDGSYVTSTALNLHSELYTVINGLQYHQETMGTLDVWIIPGEGFNERYRQEMEKGFKAKLAPDTEVRLRLVQELAFEPNGKFLLLKSNIKTSRPRRATIES